MRTPSVLTLLVFVLSGLTAACGKGIPPDLVLVHAGAFIMGSDEHDIDEKPAHSIYLDEYLIDRYEVSHAQYGDFLGATGREPPKFWDDPDQNRSEQPVVGVNWFDADAYCRWRGKRLPTEAEWEKAARGTDGRTYPWGEEMDPSRLSYDHHTKKTCDVGTYPAGASPYGAMDMAGNALEWVQDWYSTAYYSVSPDRNPRGPSEGTHRVVRGGAWELVGIEVQTFIRFGASPEGRSYLIGFRCAKDR